MRLSPSGCGSAWHIERLFFLILECGTKGIFLPAFAFCLKSELLPFQLLKTAEKHPPELAQKP